MQDAVGPIYAERGGLFGVLHDTYGKSTYDRIRVKTSYEHALDRLGLFERRAKRAPVGGITYAKGYPQPAAVDDATVDDQENGEEEESQTDAPESDVEPPKSKKASTSRARSRTPIGGRKKSE